MVVGPLSVSVVTDGSSTMMVPSSVNVPNTVSEPPLTISTTTPGPMVRLSTISGFEIVTVSGWSAVLKTSTLLVWVGTLSTFQFELVVHGPETGEVQITVLEAINGAPCGGGCPVLMMTTTVVIGVRLPSTRLVGLLGPLPFSSRTCGVLNCGSVGLSGVGPNCGFGLFSMLMI